MESKSIISLDGGSDFFTKAGLRINSGQGNSSFPPNTNVLNSNGKVTTTNCSNLILTWLLNSGDNRSQEGHPGSSPGNLKTITSQQDIQISKGNSTDRRFEQYQDSPRHLRPREDKKVKSS